MSEVEFGRYLLIEQIGRGGMGEVWRAHDTVTERVVALKVLPAQFADDAVFQERFRREARSAAALDEPHVVPIHDFGEIDGRLFVTMRLIKGRDLHSLISDGPLDPARAVGIIDQIASALHAAHKVNLVHRDVKPSNILIGDDDFAYLIDFGLARAAGQTGLTSTSTVIGTWAYMAPERLTNGQTDARADIYALACVLYECLTGSQPFGGDSLEQQIGGHIALPPPRASDHRADVPAELDAVIARGMAKNPEERWATTRALASAARAALARAPTGPNPVLPTIAAPLLYADSGQWPLSGEASTRAVSSPRDGLTQLRAIPDGPKPVPTTSRTRRLIAFSSVGAVAVIVAVFAAVALSHSGDHGSLPGTGPFTGTFNAAMGPITKWDGTARGDANAAAFSETWRLRSACGANGCVATAATGQYLGKDLVFDNVGGRWLAVTTSRRKCSGLDDVEAWNVISLQPRPDGSLAGEWVQAMPIGGCSNKRTVVFTRTADTDISKISDPATLPSRTVSPAAALHGTYDELATGAKRSENISHMGARTDCLRTGDRCVSLFVKDAGAYTFVFGSGAWTRLSDSDVVCSNGSKIHVKTTITLPLPQPPQDPIMLLTGHGFSEVTSGASADCPSQPYEQTFTRTGD